MITLSELNDKERAGLESYKRGKSFYTKLSNLSLYVRYRKLVILHSTQSYKALMYAL